MTSAFTMDKLSTIMEEMKALGPPPPQHIIVNDSVRNHWMRSMEGQVPIFVGIDHAKPNSDRTLFNGIKVNSSPLFPFDTTCKKCFGDGHGRESTYCPSCAGTGELTVEGMMAGQDAPTLLTTPSKRPLKFQPSYPKDHGPGPRR